MWVPVLLVFSMLGFYAINRIISGGKDGSKRDLVADAQINATAITDDANKELEAHSEAIEGERNGLDDAKDIDDEMKRLRALADLGNR